MTWPRAESSAMLSGVGPGDRKSPLPEADPFPATPHDHGRCVASALGTADAVCADRGTRLTDLRVEGAGLEEAVAGLIERGAA